MFEQLIGEEFNWPGCTSLCRAGRDAVTSRSVVQNRSDGTSEIPETGKFCIALFGYKSPKTPKYVTNFVVLLVLRV